MSAVHGLKNGQSVSLVNSSAQFAAEGPKHEVKVTYHSEPSYGDNGKVVRGATVGHYEVRYPNGQTSRHEHGPQANTEQARKRGANPNAKMFAAEQAIKAVDNHFRSTAMFRDRRGER